MYIFQFIADMLHLASIIFLISKILATRNCLGLSAKTVELYLIVFLTRYIDLFLYYVSFYNTFMKIAYIVATLYTLYLMHVRRPYCTTYERKKDTFPHFKYFLPAAAILTIILHSELTPFELLWSFSQWLEALAIFPQLDMIRNMREVENITSHYVGCLGAYRAFYILNWIYKYFATGKYCLVSIVAGSIQTLLYADFFYYYIKREHIWQLYCGPYKMDERMSFEPIDISFTLANPDSLSESFAESNQKNEVKVDELESQVRVLNAKLSQLEQECQQTDSTKEKYFTHIIELEKENQDLQSNNLELNKQLKEANDHLSFYDAIEKSRTDEEFFPSAKKSKSNLPSPRSGGIKNSHISFMNSPSMVKSFTTSLANFKKSQLRKKRSMIDTPIKEDNNILDKETIEERLDFLEDEMKEFRKAISALYQSSEKRYSQAEKLDEGFQQSQEAIDRTNEVLSIMADNIKDIYFHIEQLHCQYLAVDSFRIKLDSIINSLMNIYQAVKGNPSETSEKRENLDLGKHQEDLAKIKEINLNLSTPPSPTGKFKSNPIFDDSVNNLSNPEIISFRHDSANEETEPNEFRTDNFEFSFDVTHQMMDSTNKKNLRKRTEPIPKSFFIKSSLAKSFHQYQNDDEEEVHENEEKTEMMDVVGELEKKWKGKMNPEEISREMRMPIDNFDLPDPQNLLSPNIAARPQNLRKESKRTRGSMNDEITTTGSERATFINNNNLCETHLEQSKEIAQFYELFKGHTIHITSMVENLHKKQEKMEEAIQILLNNSSSQNIQNQSHTQTFQNPNFSNTSNSDSNQNNTHSLNLTNFNQKKDKSKKITAFHQHRNYNYPDILPDEDIENSTIIGGMTIENPSKKSTIKLFPPTLRKGYRIANIPLIQTKNKKRKNKGSETLELILGPSSKQSHREIISPHEIISQRKNKDKKKSPTRPGRSIEDDDPKQKRNSSIKNILLSVPRLFSRGLSSNKEKKENIRKISTARDEKKSISNPIKDKEKERQKKLLEAEI